MQGLVAVFFQPFTILEQKNNQCGCTWASRGYPIKVPHQQSSPQAKPSPVLASPPSVIMQAQRGDAIIQVINHLAATVVAEVGILGASPESSFQAIIEQTTTPFPYGLLCSLSSLPIVLRIIATIIFLALTVKFLICPTLGWVKAFKTIQLHRPGQHKGLQNYSNHKC